MPEPSPASRYVLEGRVVTMGGRGVLDDAALFIADGRIEAVAARGEPEPAGYGAAPRIRTGDTLYPGLIELHNHLCYNAMRLWDVPRPFSNNGQWKGEPAYQRAITKPSQVLGRSEGVVEALVRWTECRCLLGGTTTSQGITLAGTGIQKYYRGLVRNVEDPLGDRPGAGTRIANPARDEGAAYLATLERNRCYLQHISEGVDDTARGWFLNLRLDDDRWALSRAFAGVHATALGEEDLRVIAEHDGSVVWSPLSNLLLYGGTLDIRAARAAGVRMGLGSDWAPSGSKNLLGELKVAWLVSRQQGDVFTPEELVAMATREAAVILGWEDDLGTLEAGRRADLIAVNGRRGDPFESLLRARETSLTLVVVDGVPRLGQPSLMARFGVEGEEVTLGRSRRRLYLHDPSSDPLVGDLGFGEAERRLRDAMANLPALAAILDARSDGGLAAGSADRTGARWRVALDFEEEDAADPVLAGAARPLAEFVEPMSLEGATVADDPDFLARLVAQRNLPLFLKEQLPGLYGLELPIPDSAAFLEPLERSELPLEFHTTRDLQELLARGDGLGADDRVGLVDQALLDLERHYVHLPFKRAMHATDPLQRLRLLRDRLIRSADGEPDTEASPYAVHRELLEIFASLRDLHTSYTLPWPFAGAVAWLPIQIEAYWQQGRWRYLVSKVVGRHDAALAPGVEVLHWNGVPIGRAVEAMAARQPAGNAAAGRARALDGLTLRPLASGPAPDEAWVTLAYRDLEGREREWRQRWLAFFPSAEPGGEGETRRGLDPHTRTVQRAKALLFAGATVNRTRAGASRRPGGDAEGVTTMPTVLRARREGDYGYLRLFTFDVPDADEFLDEVERVLDDLPQNGLILDVRGNPGGLIPAAEGLLQLLTPRRVEPARAQFLNTPANLELCAAHAPSSRIGALDLSPWLPSLREAVRTGAVYSLGYPITSPAWLAQRAQRYYGPIVLVTDALCYSATDIFAAGFQDHAVGFVLGLDGNTGAGGANVWSHDLLVELMRARDGARAPDPSRGDGPYRRLPGGAGLRLAVRRTLRTGPNAGVVLEDLGVAPDAVYRPTRRDLLENNADLIASASQILDGLERFGLEVALAGTRLRVRTANLTRLDVSVAGRPHRSFDVSDGSATLDLDRLPAAGPGATLEVSGYRGDALVACRRQPL